MGVGSLEDPEVILEAAQNELKDKLQQVKMQGVAVLQQKNQLEVMLADKKEEQRAMEAKVRQALTAGREDLAEALMQEQMTIEETVAGLEKQYAQAVEISEQVKKQVRAFEQQVQAKYREKLQLKTQWKQAQITEKLNEALSGITTDTTSEAWDRAKEKIKEKQARAAALTELGNSSIKNDMAELNAETNRMAARERLNQMKAELNGGESTDSVVKERLAKIKEEMGSK
jgi:phage shock protein A